MVTVNTISVKSIISKSKIPGYDYAINPYVGCPHRCVYCYAEYMRRFTGHTEPWGQFLDVKSCPVPLKPAQLFHTHVMLSSVTDPYNPFEEKYGLTRQLLKQLAYCQAYVHIHTKSPLVLRDIDLLATMPGCEVIFSIATTDENFRQLAEPGASADLARVTPTRHIHCHYGSSVYARYYRLEKSVNTSANVCRTSIIRYLKYAPRLPDKNTPFY